MKKLAAIVGAWMAIDSWLQREENKALSRKWKRVEARIQARRVANDRAFFLLLFAHFEDHLSEKTRRLIIRRQAVKAWAGRRGWDVLDAGKVDRIPFMHRVAYCTDKREPDWTTIRQYYKVRNELAHEGSSGTKVAIPSVALDLDRIGRSLKA